MAAEVSKIMGVAAASISKVFGVAVASVGKMSGIAYPAGGGGLPLEGWTYRKSITLSRASGAVNNYQMKLLVGESSGATGEDVDCGGHVAADFDDLRFTTSDGETLLDYWIESISGATPNQLATIWIEFDTIGTGATTFYMYYGNADAAAYSNGTNTFITFDDFERGNNGDAVGGDWTGVVGVVISTDHAYGGNRCAKIPGSAASYNRMSISRAAASGEYAVQYRFWKENAANFTTAHGNGTKRIQIGCLATEDIKYYTTAWVDTTKNCLADQWDIIEFNNINFATPSFDIYYTGFALAKSGAGMWSNADCNGIVHLYEENCGVGNDIYIDNFLIRNHRATEPAWGAWGEEES